jgi:FixJ family two-component response regulator
VPKRPLVAIVDDDESVRETTKDLLDSADLAARHDELLACIRRAIRSLRGSIE